MPKYQPLGPISHAIIKAAERPSTAGDIAKRVGIDYETARNTIYRLVKRGELVKDDDTWPRLYQTKDDGKRAAIDILQSWPGGQSRPVFCSGR